MNWKKFAKKSLELIELIAQLEPSVKEKKQRAIRDIETTYNSAFLSGNMTYGESQDWKSYWTNTINSKS